MLGLDPRRSAILLDDHPLWLDALTKLCDDVGIDVLATATSAEDALKHLEELRSDLLVADLGRRRGGTIAACVHEARRRRPALRVLVITGHDDPDSVDEVLRAGADAFVSKRADAEDIAAALRQVFRRSVFIGPRRLTENGREGPRVERNGLTKREREILGLVSQGYTNGQVAKMLWVTDQTVKFHLSNVYRKLGVSNRTEATHWAYINGSSEGLRTNSPVAT
jgi:two-component system response regulator DesR